MPTEGRDSTEVNAWMGVHIRVHDDTGFSCTCGDRHDSEFDSMLHVEWALNQQVNALWNAGQRVCNGVTGAVEQLGRALDACRPVNPQDYLNDLKADEVSSNPAKVNGQ